MHGSVRGSRKRRLVSARTRAGHRGIEAVLDQTQCPPVGPGIVGKGAVSRAAVGDVERVEPGLADEPVGQPDGPCGSLGHRGLVHDPEAAAFHASDQPDEDRGGRLIGDERVEAAAQKPSRQCAGAGELRDRAQPRSLEQVVCLDDQTMFSEAILDQIGQGQDATSLAIMQDLQDFITNKLQTRSR